MTISYRVQEMRNTEASFAVTTSGMTLTLAATSFTYWGRSMSIGEFDYAVEGDATHGTQVALCIAVAEADGALSLLCDEVVLDGVDRPMISWKGTGYKRLLVLGVFDVPAGTTSLDDLDIELLRLTRKPEPEPEPEES